MRSICFHSIELPCSQDLRVFWADGLLWAHESESAMLICTRHAHKHTNTHTHTHTYTHAHIHTHTHAHTHTNTRIYAHAHNHSHIHTHTHTHHAHRALKQMEMFQRTCMSELAGLQTEIGEVQRAKSQLEAQLQSRETHALCVQHELAQVCMCISIHV